MLTFCIIFQKLFNFTIIYFTFPIWNIQLMKKLQPKLLTVTPKMQQLFQTVLDKLFWEKPALPHFQCCLCVLTTSVWFRPANFHSIGQHWIVFFSNILYTIVALVLGIEEILQLQPVHNLSQLTSWYIHDVFRRDVQQSKLNWRYP